ncbi:hypothetical protein AAF712_006959 [Marasmius tenuissimus]|uniref:Uncharacterized protein n=1 Tax=Marasmius tenuissimus TaxID=585030 RepID=A0ABR2ZWA9_9AGAR
MSATASTSAGTTAPLPQPSTGPAAASASSNSSNVPKETEHGASITSTNTRVLNPQGPVASQGVASRMTSVPMQQMAQPLQPPLVTLQPTQLPLTALQPNQLQAVLQQNLEPQQLKEVLLYILGGTDAIGGGNASGPGTAQ